MSKEEYVSFVTEELASLKSQRDAAQKRLDYFNQINEGDKLLSDIYRERHTINLLNLRIDVLERTIRSEAYYRIFHMSDKEAEIYIEAKKISITRKISETEDKLAKAYEKYEQLTTRQIALIERYSSATDETEKQAIKDESIRVQEELHLYDEFFDGNVITRYKRQIEKLRKQLAVVSTKHPSDVREALMEKSGYSEDEKLLGTIHDHNIKGSTFWNYYNRLFAGVQNDSEKALELCGLLFDYSTLTKKRISGDIRSFTTEELSAIETITGHPITGELTPGLFETEISARTKKIDRYYYDFDRIFPILNNKIKCPFPVSYTTEELQRYMHNIMEAFHMSERDSSPYWSYCKEISSDIKSIFKLISERQEIESRKLPFLSDKNRLSIIDTEINKLGQGMICKLIDVFFKENCELMFGGSYPEYSAWTLLPPEVKYEQTLSFVRKARDDAKQHKEETISSISEEIRILSKLKKKVDEPLDIYKAEITRRIMELAGPDFTLDDLDDLVKGNDFRGTFSNGFLTNYPNPWHRMDLSEMLSLFYYKKIIEISSQKAKIKASYKRDEIGRLESSDRKITETYRQMAEDTTESLEPTSSYPKPEVAEESKEDEFKRNHPEIYRLYDELASDTETMDALEDLTVEHHRRF